MITNEILNALPGNYGEVFCNFDSIDIAPGNRIGLVVPTFRRPEYVEICLKSLAESDLQNVILCFIDESVAKCDLPALENYILYNNVDSPGNDLKNVWITTGGDIRKIKQLCDDDPQCAGFNTYGWLKSQINPDLSLMKNTVFGLYVKDHISQQQKTIHQAEDNCADPQETAALIESFVHPSVPIIKILKTRHGWMYDSLRVGWDLLKNVFNCAYLCCLDSDTIVKKDWINSLITVHHKVKTKNQYFVVTGFNSTAHPIISKHDGYCIKSSVGGTNLFFHANIYHNLRHSLNSIDWDDEFVRRIQLMKGVLFCTQPSVIQHIGKDGVWSNGKSYDVAEDFR